MPSSAPTGYPSRAELALFSIPPATPGNSSEIAGNELNLLINICRDTQVDPKTALKKFEVIFQPENFEIVFQNQKLVLYSVFYIEW